MSALLLSLPLAVPLHSLRRDVESGSGFDRRSLHRHALTTQSLEVGDEGCATIFDLQTPVPQCTRAGRRQIVSLDQSGERLTPRDTLRYYYLEHRELVLVGASRLVEQLFLLGEKSVLHADIAICNGVSRPSSERRSGMIKSASLGR